MKGVPNIPLKYPKKVEKKGTAMDYSSVAFPKPTKKKKRKEVRDADDS